MMFQRGILCIIAIVLPLLVCSLRRHHNRRSIASDGRFLGFRFENEPDSGFTRNGNLILHCQYSIEKVDIKDVRLEWKKDGSLVSYKGYNNRIQLHSNGSLSISDASTVDEGSYQCIIYLTSFGGSAWTFMSRKALIRLPDLPKFEAQPIDHTVVRGQPVVFHCLVFVRPPATAVWYHNEQVISQNEEYHILPVSHSLEISSVQLHHEGEYKCVVEGAEKRRTSHGARLRIDYNSVPTELMFLSAPRTQTVNEGEDILLECLSTAKSKPEVRWLKDARQLIVDGIRIRHVGISSLIITSASISDAGLYTCRASSIDDSLDRTVTVDVRASPHLTTRPQDKIALETADVEFECMATGRPLPLISWYKNGEAIIATEYFVIEAYRLRILGLVKTDQGVYQCMAENEVGSEQAAVQLLIDSAGPTYLSTVGLGNVTIPLRINSIHPLPADDSSSIAASSGQPLVASAPLGIRAGSIGSRFVTLEWDPPVQRNGHIMRYHVFYREEDSDRERMLNSSTTSATLTALQPNTLYLLKVAAENEAGMGKASDHIKVTTKKEQAVPGRVINLKANSLGPETIEVKWDPPIGGLPAVRYKLFYIRNPPGNDKETQTIISSTQYTLHGMEKFTEYLIRVEAEGENGSGLSSETLKVRTLSDVPSSAPRDIVAEPSSSASVRVTWVEPEEENANGEITGYRLKYKTKLRGSKGNTFVIDASEREYVITGLDPNTQYLIRMAVVNHNGTGPYSDWLRVDTLLTDKEEALLGAPRELRPQAGPDYILISWLPPADETILVRGYQIGWGHNVPDLSTERVGASVLQHKITGLKAARDYVVSLRAFNKQGSGFPIYETVRTLSHGPGSYFFDINAVDAASTPLGVRAEGQSATSIRVSWTEPDPNAFNTLYTVRYSTSSDGNQLRYVNSSESWVLIDNLRPSTEYEFAVRAIASGGGVSQWSMAARNKTFVSAPSSAPRDLTVLPAASGDPHMVSLNWQPPKYSNGEIEEYLIYYTDRVSLADKDWIINYVPGDRLNHHVSNLLPKTTYHFKIQARNEKGYGPLSTIHSFHPSVTSRPSGILRPASTSDSQWKELLTMFTSNRMYLAVVTVFALLVLLCIILIAVCVMKRSTKQKRGYTAAKKSSSHQQSNDMWINHPTGSHVRGASDYAMEGIGANMTDMKHFSGPEVVESPPPRYQALQDSAYGSVSVRQSRTPIRQSVSSYEDGETRRPLIVGRAKPIFASATSCGASEDNSQGTLSRSYHHSSTSLEGRQRTPQVVYTGSGRHQPIAKIDFPDSPYGSSTALAPGTPPFPVQAPPAGPPTIVDGYRTLRGTPPGSNPLRSFTQLAGAPPTSQQRPVVIAAGGRKLPVGRATAQPRVNVANIYSPYATCSSDTETEKKQAQVEMQSAEHASTIQPSNSTEELNAHIQDLDNVVGDLQDWQAEFESM